MELNLENINQILLFILIAQSFFAAIIFFLQKSDRKKASSLLSLFMLFVFLFSLAYFSYFYKVKLLLDVLKFVFLPAAFCIIPILYLYLKALTINDVHFGKKEIIHFIPAIVTLLFLKGYYFFSDTQYIDVYVSSYWDNSWRLELTPFMAVSVFILQDVIFFAQLVIYFILMYLMLHRHRRNIRKYFSDIEQLKLSWITAFMTMFLIFGVAAFSAEFFFDLETKHYEFLYNFSAVIYIFFITYYGLNQRDIYEIKGKAEKKTEKILEDTIDESSEKSAVSNIPSPREEIMQEVEPENNSKDMLLLNKLEKLFTEEKLYLKTDLSLAEIARNLGTNKQHISHLLHEHLQTNFYRYVNAFRIEESLELLKNSENGKYTIETIAEMCGFKSKSSFNKFFKEKTGKTPSEYRKSM